MAREKIYPGIEYDEYGGMTPTGNIIKDAWVFGIIPEDQTCEGWSLSRIQALYDKVCDAWAPYGHLVSKLPQDLAERHTRIYDAAIKQAREQGWAPDIDDET
jgi:hypothetical protein